MNGIHQGNSAAVFPNGIVDKCQNFLLRDLLADLREAEIIKVVQMVSAQAEAGGIKAVQIPDAPTQNTPLQPQKIGFYEQFQAMRKHMGAIFIGAVAGTICCLGSIYILCRFFGFDRVLTMSLLPKGITNAIGVALSKEIGGIAAITSTGIAITGTFCNITAPSMAKLMKLDHPIAQGVGFGTASHVIGTSQATEVDPLAGAVSSLSLAVSGILTAVLFPLMLILL